jgi:hypothetical protein
LTDVASDEIVYAIGISAHGAALLCSAAGISPPEWEDREWAEPMVRSQTLGLTKRSLEEIIAEDDILSRRPIVCSLCGGSFTVDQYDRLGRMHRDRRYETVGLVHEGCEMGE